MVKLTAFVQLVISLCFADMVCAMPATAQGVVPGAVAAHHDQNIEIYAYIAPRSIATGLGRGGSNSNARIEELLRTGKIRPIYHEMSSASAGSVGRTGTFEREISKTFDKRGKIIDRKVAPEPLGLITTWQHERPGLAIDIAYYEAGPETKVGKDRLPSYLHTSTKGQRVGVFDHPYLYVMSLPRDNSFGDDAMAVVVVSPQRIDPSAALAGAEVAGSYVRY